MGTTFKTALLAASVGLALGGCSFHVGSSNSSRPPSRSRTKPKKNTGSSSRGSNHVKPVKKTSAPKPTNTASDKPSPPRRTTQADPPKRTTNPPKRTVPAAKRTTPSAKRTEPAAKRTDPAAKRTETGGKRTAPTDDVKIKTKGKGKGKGKKVKVQDHSTTVKTKGKKVKVTDHSTTVKTKK